VSVPDGHAKDIVTRKKGTTRVVGRNHGTRHRQKAAHSGLSRLYVNTGQITVFVVFQSVVERRWRAGSDGTKAKSDEVKCQASSIHHVKAPRPESAASFPNPWNVLHATGLAQ
jgi:hypothetical protein